MNKELLETIDLLSFVKIVEEGSLSAAAQALGIPRATVTRRLSQLEKRLNTRLIRRTTRSLALTDAGQALYLHAQIALDAIKNAESSVQRQNDSIHGDLRISVPPMQANGFHRLLCEFASKHPGLRVHVHFSSEFVDLHREGFDVALRASSEMEPGLVARTLMREKVIAVCSPAYIKARGEPTTLRDLKKHSCLMGFSHGKQRQNHWVTKNKRKIFIEGSLFSSDLSFLISAVDAGLGIAMLPTSPIQPLLDQKRLVRVLPNLLEGEAQVAIVYPEREFVPPQVKAFVDTFTSLSNKEFLTK
jgi:DNA-binding transcriptional LysR family regulator